VLRDIAQRRDGSELPETSRRGQQRRTHHGRLAPAVKVKPQIGLRAVNHDAGDPTRTGDRV